MKNYFFLLLLISNFSFAQPAHCLNMANMAMDIANIRDMGVAKEAVIARLDKDVSDVNEKAYAITVVHIVYSGRHSGNALRREILKKCK